MARGSSPQTAFEHSLFDVLRTAFRITRSNPRFALRALRLMRRQQKAARVRSRHERAGTHVPPFVIYSITEQCNLSCDGCYANLLHRTEGTELEDARVRGLFHEARSLGVSVMLLAGGEPMIRDGLLELTSTAPEILFLLFTNGSLLTEPRVRELRNQPHVIPVLSLEGDQDLTDARRGTGTHANILGLMARLQNEHVFFGTSTTLTRENFDLATSEDHLRDLLRRGCKLFYFINYVPVQEGTDDLQLTAAQVQELERRLTQYRRSLPALFIAFPHDEMALGGCLAAGRGFVHINAVGDVEPCPFSPFSDSNLAEVSLRKALGSPLFAKILSSDVKLDERDGRCALWKQRDWVAGLLGETEQRTEAVPASVGEDIRPSGSGESLARSVPVLGASKTGPVTKAEKSAESGTDSHKAFPGLPDESEHLGTRH